MALADRVPQKNASVDMALRDLFGIEIVLMDLGGDGTGTPRRFAYGTCNSIFRVAVKGFHWRRCPAPLFRPASAFYFQKVLQQRFLQAEFDMYQRLAEVRV